jgi:hypothetical protein
VPLLGGLAPTAVKADVHEKLLLQLVGALGIGGRDWALFAVGRATPGGRGFATRAGVQVGDDLPGCSRCSSCGSEREAVLGGVWDAVPGGEYGSSFSGRNVARVR